MLTWVCLTGCETWIRRERVFSPGGSSHAVTSLTDCQSLCIDTPTCVAVDILLSSICLVHENPDDLSTTFSLQASTQYILNRACLLPTTTSASSTASTVSSIRSTTQPTYFGKGRRTSAFNSKSCV